MRVRALETLKNSITKDKSYKVISESSRFFVLVNDSGYHQRLLKERFEMTGSIYLICAVEPDALKNGTYDVLDHHEDNRTATTLEEAKKWCKEIYGGIEDKEQYTAAIFELHSYYENKPFFFQVK